MCRYDLSLQEVCYQYWPSSGSLTYGEFTVEIVGEEMMEGYVLKTLSIKHTEVCCIFY